RSGSGRRGSGRRGSGLRWKLALLALALIGAGAGAATIMALRHHSNTAADAAAGQSTGTGQSTGSGPVVTGKPLSVNYWIDHAVPATSSIPGFKSYSRCAATAG